MTGTSGSSISKFDTDHILTETMTNKKIPDPAPVGYSGPEQDGPQQRCPVTCTALCPDCEISVLGSQV